VEGNAHRVCALSCLFESKKSEKKIKKEEQRNVAEAEAVARRRQV